MIQVYTGDGKGKTTASIGLALRAVGQGKRVFMVQFMKGSVEYGEILMASKIEGFTIRQFGRPDLVDKRNPLDEDFKGGRQALECARQVIEAGVHDILILDEIHVALDFRLIALEDVLDLIDRKPESLELILTGRYAHPEVLKRADLITEMKEIRHYYTKGVPARKGIEY